MYGKPKGLGFMVQGSGFRVPMVFFFNALQISRILSMPSSVIRNQHKKTFSLLSG